MYNKGTVSIYSAFYTTVCVMQYWNQTVMHGRLQFTQPFHNLEFDDIVFNRSEASRHGGVTEPTINTNALQYGVGPNLVWFSYGTNYSIYVGAVYCSIYLKIISKLRKEDPSFSWMVGMGVSNIYNFKRKYLKGADRNTLVFLYLKLLSEPDTTVEGFKQFVPHNSVQSKLHFENWRTAEQIKV